MSHSENKLGLAIIGLCLLFAPGCAMLPYEDDFACKNDDHGKCIHPELAYREAVGAPGGGEEAAIANRASGPVAGGYAGYQDAVYQQLASIVDEPVTPMVAPAKTIRTLILPYADTKAQGRLFMPRFVYSVLEGPRFVLGDYLTGRENDFAGALARGLIAPGNLQPDAQSDPAHDDEPQPLAAPNNLPAGSE